MSYIGPKHKQMLELQRHPHKLDNWSQDELQSLSLSVVYEHSKAQAENEDAQKFATMSRQQRRYLQRKCGQCNGTGMTAFVCDDGHREYTEASRCPNCNSDPIESVAKAGKRLGLRGVSEEDQQINLEAGYL